MAVILQDGRQTTLFHTIHNIIVRQFGRINWNLVCAFFGISRKDPAVEQSKNPRWRPFFKMAAKQPCFIQFYDINVRQLVKLIEIWCVHSLKYIEKIQKWSHQKSKMVVVFQDGHQMTLFHSILWLKSLSTSVDLIEFGVTVQIFAELFNISFQILYQLSWKFVSLKTRKTN